MEEDIISKDEMDLMIDLVDDFYPEEQRLKIKALISLLYLTGHRVSEVLELRKDDFRVVDDKVNISIYVQKRREPYKHTVWFSLSKTPYIDLVIEYVESVESEKLLFESEYGLDKPMTRQYVGKILKTLNPRIHPHLFRHTRATLFARMGYTPYQIQIWFGWKTPTESNKYIAKGTILLGNMGENIV